MKSQVLSLGLIAALLITIFSVRGYAFETDQYNLPPEPLTDIGDEFSAYVTERMNLAVFKLNVEIAARESCLEIKGPHCGSERSERRNLEDLKSADGVAKAVYGELGRGNIFVSDTGKWLKTHKFAKGPYRYKADYLDSIFITRPVTYATLSPTVRIYGAEFGTDKIDHFFQQGYKYFQICRKGIAKGKTPDEAVRDAIKWGQRTERQFFGTLVSGVYSNADLFANYAGMRFFQRLTAPIDLSDGTRLPPALVLRDGKKWYASATGEQLLRPFMTDHMNEALNPSGYNSLRYSVVKRVVRDKACPGWKKQYPNATAAEFETRSRALEKWNGEDYGFTRKSKSVYLAVCFENGPI